MSVQNAIIKALEPYRSIIKTITSDNGTEFANHQAISKAIGCNWFFADPYKSQQRGINENQNGLIRQYFTNKPICNKLLMNNKNYTGKTKQQTQKKTQL